MGVVVDTNIFINAENARVDPDAVLAEGEYYFLAAVSASELLAGVSLAKDQATRLHRMVWCEFGDISAHCLAIRAC